jgi:hypothetical protein
MCVDTASVAVPRLGGVWRAAVVLVRQVQERIGLRHPAPAPATRALRPIVVPGALSDLNGPATGVLELPQWLCWSLPADKRRFDLADPHQVRAAYEYVIDAARTQADLADWLNAGLLASVWGQLGMGRVKRQKWETALPALAGRRAAAA